MFTPWEVQNLIVNRPDVAAQLRNASPAEADGILEKAMGHRHVTINILGAQPEGEEGEEHEEGNGRKERKRKRDGEGERLAKEQPPVAPPRDLPTLDLDAPASPDATPPPVQPGPVPGAPSPQIPLFTPPNARGAQNNPPAGLSKAESELAGSFEPLCKAAKVEPLPQPKPFPLPAKTTAGNAAVQPGKSEDAQAQAPAPEQQEEQPDPTLYQAYMGGGGPVVVDRSTDRRMADQLAAEKAAKRR